MNSKSQKCKKMTKNLPELPNPTAKEQAAIARTRQKIDAQPQPPRVSIQLSADGQPCFDASHSDGIGWMTHLTGTFGSNSSDFALENLQFLMKFPRAGLAPDDAAVAVNSLLAVISGIAPQNEVESVLAVQMAASHQLAMTLLSRAARAEHIQMLESNGNMAVKLLRISREHADALAKLRRGGNQTVRVEHVHVHSGGQAVVGNVTYPGRRGPKQKTDDQPHAPGAKNADTRFSTTEPVTPLRSQDPDRKPVPVTRREGTNEVPDARRHEG
jgi:hypothetical protein